MHGMVLHCIVRVPAIRYTGEKPDKGSYQACQITFNGKLKKT